MKSQKVEDIECADWYARLAFGIYQGKESLPTTLPENSKQLFYVIP